MSAPKTPLLQATVARFPGVGTWTYADLPFDCVAFFGLKGTIHVAGTLNGKPIRSNLRPHGDGRHFILLPKPIRDQTGIVEGDEITLQLWQDTAPTEQETPEDLAEALTENPVAEAFFQSLAPSARKEYLVWLADAKKAETRHARVRKAVEKLGKGERLK